MTTINCIVEEKGVRCSTTLEVTEPMSPQFKFICKNHPDTVQRRAAGNTRLKRPDVHFQEYQFDKDLGKQFKRKPMGTEHIHTPSPSEYQNLTAPHRAFKKEKDE
jgi:hypothetical protein